MPPYYGCWGPMWFFPMGMPIIMLVVLLLCLYFIFGRGGFRPLWPNIGRPFIHGGGVESAWKSSRIGMLGVRSPRTNLRR